MKLTFVRLGTVAFILERDGEFDKVGPKIARDFQREFLKRYAWPDPAWALIFYAGVAIGIALARGGQGTVAVFGDLINVEVKHE